VYENALPHEQVEKGSEQAHIERFFGLAHGCQAQYVQNSRSGPQPERPLHLTMKLFVE